jgi:hypothetical protein
VFGMSMQEPGLDRHEWETELASLEEDLRDDPQAALPQLADLVERMLAERGVEERDELADEFRAARETADRCERGEADAGDVGAAVESLRSVAATLLVERSTP